ncbi:MAG: SagB/ThcOx family dehydrogenase [Bacillota bacterium]|nr:SagB/ThcOx family dehydrogenase [Bacillota bacterium]
MDDIGPQFMERTKYRHLPPSDQTQGLPQPPLFKEWPDDRPLIDLPAPGGISVRPVDLTAAINSRRSVRSYTDQPLTMEELSYLLWCTQGVKEVTPRPATSRTVPSAGARHPLETYILVNRVEGVEPGVYAFVADQHKLRPHLTGSDLGGKFAAVALRQNMVARSAVTFIWSAVAYRSIWRYNQRAYRYMHLDAGHACAHLYLAVAAVDAGCCAIAAFDDDACSTLLELDGEDEFVIYMAAVGKLPRPA